MRRFGAVCLVAIALGIGNYVHSLRLSQAQEEIRQLKAELQVLNAAQSAERAAFAKQTNIIREAGKHAQNAHRKLAEKAGLSDADWLGSVLGSVWNADTNGGSAAPCVDAGTLPGAGSGSGAEAGKDAPAVQ